MPGSPALAAGGSITTLTANLSASTSSTTVAVADAAVIARTSPPSNSGYLIEIDGEQMETYIDWMKSCYFISVTGHPAISVPAGFTFEGLPVGIQIVGRYQDEFGVPVRWIATRLEDFQLTLQGRDQVNLAEAAFTDEGVITALKTRTIYNLVAAAFPSG